MAEINRQWCVADAPHGPGIALSREHFEYREAEIPSPNDGEVLIRNTYLACDPMNHAWVKGLEHRFQAIPLGKPMCGGVAGEIVASRHPAFKVGDRVCGFLELADYALSGPLDRCSSPLRHIPADFSLATGLATLGMTGLCAWFGLADIGRPMPGETVVVSGAAGAIGNVAGQLARLSGARVIGIAGGERKCNLLAGELGFDAAIDYRNEDVSARLAELCPRGIDVFFDNVGGPILDTALAHMAHGGRIVICGGIAGYNSEVPGLRNHMMLAIKACTMAGFFFFDHVARFEEAADRLAGLLRGGRLRELLDVAEGFDRYPDAALGQFAGSNTGKQLVRIRKEPGY